MANLGWMQIEIMSELWRKIISFFGGEGNESQKLKQLEFDLNKIKSDNLKKNFKRISKSRIDYIETSLNHKKIFLEALGDVEESLVLISSWKTSYVMNSEFEESFRSCIAKGINIYVGYINSQYNYEVDENLDAKKKINELQAWCFREYGQDCRMHEISEPKQAATLIVDEKYIIIGNCENDKKSWIFFDSEFVISERNTIIGNFDGPQELTRRRLLKRVFPGTLI